MATPTLRVAIIGAGPGGCMLARLLTCGPNADKIEVVVFEAEASLDFRSQGGTLDLHQESGLLAMKEAGLWEPFRKHARYDGEALRACDKRAVTWLKMSPSDPDKAESSNDRPEIDRKELRRILVEGLPEGVVRWGWTLKKVDEKLVLHFDNGRTESGYDLIVGADGAWSKTRALLSDQMPFYAGLGGHDFTIHDAANAFPEIYNYVNRGSLMSFSDGKALIAQQLGDGNIMLYAWSVRSEDWTQTSSFNVHDGPETKAAVLKEFHDWHPRLLSLVQAAEGKATPRSLYMLPVGFRWGHRRGITLIGDAAHLMSPFAGEGVNLSLADALDLSRAILSSLADSEMDFDSHIVKFEDEMLKRSTDSQRESEANMKVMFFTAGAPRSVVEQVLCRGAKEHVHPVFYPVTVVVIYTVFFFYKAYVDIFL